MIRTRRAVCAKGARLDIVLPRPTGRSTERRESAGAVIAR